MNDPRTLVFHSIAGDFCHECGRTTRLRCVNCNPMHYVCCQCLEGHAASHQPGAAGNRSRPAALLRQGYGGQAATY